MSTSPSSYTSSSSSTSSQYSLSPPGQQQRKCVICSRVAYSNNYGVLSCDACKMFYRRIVCLNREYQCKYQGRCREIYDKMDVKCRGCRYQMCLEAGMTFQPTFLELTNEKDVDVATLIGTILFLDSKRTKAMKTQFTDEDFTLKEILTERRMRMKKRKSGLSNHEWSFLGIYTSIEFLMSLDFMTFLSDEDKSVLLKHFCVKASLFASAMRAIREKRDRLMTVDGNDVYPDCILNLKVISLQLLNRIRSLLVARLINLKLTDEEFSLVNVVFFCNPALPLSNAGIEIVATQQKIYSAALLQYCNVAYERNGPSRFTDLISILSVVNKNYEDVQAMTMIFKLHAKNVVYRKIVAEVI
uniref:Nuclear receptor domain-containing protein n=1 Tax=Caenorhabditis tropicalis TaxID=1561998 RepID=A0A1I7TY60_9PELO